VRTFNNLAKTLNPKYCLLFGALLIHSLAVNSSSNFSSILFHINSMKFDKGISINHISDHPTHVELRGKSLDKLSAYKLAEKLLYSLDLRSYQFVDSVPFWQKSEMIIILKKNRKPDANSFVLFNSPDTRSVIKEDFDLTGLCSREGGEISISGDIQGKSKCKDGEWKLSLKIKSKFREPIIGVSISQRGMTSETTKDFRSFVTN
jgi:hypothetical protein